METFALPHCHVSPQLVGFLSEVSNQATFQGEEMELFVDGFCLQDFTPAFYEQGDPCCIWSLLMLSLCNVQLPV